MPCDCHACMFVSLIERIAESGKAAEARTARLEEKLDDYRIVACYETDVAAAEIEEVERLNARIAILEKERDEAFERCEQLRQMAAGYGARIAELERENAALLKPHNSDGTITCGNCGKTTGSDGIVESLREALDRAEKAEATLASTGKGVRE